MTGGKGGQSTPPENPQVALSKFCKQRQKKTPSPFRYYLHMTLPLSNAASGPSGVRPFIRVYSLWSCVPLGLRRRKKNVYPSVLVSFWELIKWLEIKVHFALAAHPAAGWHPLSVSGKGPPWLASSSGQGWDKVLKAGSLGSTPPPKAVPFCSSLTKGE